MLKLVSKTECGSSFSDQLHQRFENIASGVRTAESSMKRASVSIRPASHLGASLRLMRPVNLISALVARLGEGKAKMATDINNREDY